MYFGQNTYYCSIGPVNVIAHLLAGNHCTSCSIKKLGVLPLPFPPPRMGYKFITGNTQLFESFF